MSLLNKADMCLLSAAPNVYIRMRIKYTFDAHIKYTFDAHIKYIYTHWLAGRDFLSDVYTLFGLSVAWAWPPDVLVLSHDLTT